LIATAEIAKTIMQATVKVIERAEKIIARVDRLQAEVERVQALMAAKRAEADARKTEAEVTVAKIEYRAVVAIETKQKEEVAAKVAEKKKVAKTARKEASEKASAVKGIEERIKLLRAKWVEEEVSEKVKLMVEAAAKRVEEKASEKVKLMEAEAKRVEEEAKMKVAQKIATRGYVVQSCGVYGRDNGTVSFIDLASHVVTDTIRVGKRPTEVAVISNGTRAYVTNRDSGTVSVIDTAAHPVIDTIPVVRQEEGWDGEQGYLSVAVTPDGTNIYVITGSRDWHRETITVIDTVSHTVIATVKVGRHPQRIVISPNGTQAYVTNYKSGTVSVIDTIRDVVVATVKVGRAEPDGGKGPDGVAITPDGMKVYVTNPDMNTVSVIGTVSYAVIATIKVELEPTGVAITPDGMKIYVVNHMSNNVSVIVTVSHKVIATIPVKVQLKVQLDEVAVTFNGTRAYVMRRSGGDPAIIVIDTVSDKVIAYLERFTDI
jgi:YVTN family beta-propeller protein